MWKIGVAKLNGKGLENYLGILKRDNIDLLEVGFGPDMSVELPTSFVKQARDLEVNLGCHLPFNINLGAEQDGRRSIRYLIQGLSLANSFDGVAVFHPGFYRGASFQDLRRNLVYVLNQAVAEVPSGNGKLGVETTGKVTEIGALEEVLALVHEVGSKSVVPVIDWAHIYARSQGKFPATPEDFFSVLDRVKREVSSEHLYFHASGIEFGRGGEKRHLPLKTCAPPIPYLLHVLKENKLDFQLVIESPDPVEDAKWTRMVLSNPEIWFSLVEEEQRKSHIGFLDSYL